MRRAILFVLLFAGVMWAADIPRAEFPQPQFERELWQSLNGPWEFEFDDANAGIREDWAAAGKKFTRSIVVPYAFETKLSGIADPTFHPYIWYRRSFTVPAAWQGKRVLLHFGAVDYRAGVWVNGRKAGEHEGGNVPFAFDVTPLLKAGANAANTIVVRAEDPPTDRFIPRGKQYWEVKSRSIFYTRTSGIWQPVWLEAAGASYLDKVRITTPAGGGDDIVRFDGKVVNPQPDVEFVATISFNKRTVATVSIPAVERPGAAARINAPRRWSVDSPNLYDVVFELKKGGEVLDRVKSYFGFRTVSIDDGRVAINGRRIYLKFVLDQGYWPESNLTPPSDEAMQYDIRLTKQMGFNGARKHQKVEDPRFLYWADKMGFLVSGEMANAYEFDEQYVERFTREWTEAVERDYSHPSIIMWAPINESWGVPNLLDPRQQAHLKELYWLTRALDPTRLVIDNEGWEHTDTTDLFAFHDYARTGDLIAEKYKELGKPGAPVPKAGKWGIIPGYKYNGSPMYLSEFGGIAFIPPNHEVPKEAWGYSGVEKTQADALNRLRGIYAAIAGVPAIVGVCYTQITDVEQEINGLMTYDRKPKFDPAVIREINAMLK